MSFDNIIDSEIHLSNENLKEIPFPNEIVLNPSNDFNIPQSDDFDDSLSISGSSINSDYNSCMSTINRGVSTLNTNIISLNKNNYDDTTDINTTSIISQESSNRLNSSKIDEKDDMEKDDNEDALFPLENKQNIEDEQTGNNNINFHYNKNNTIDYDKESKEVRGRPSACVFVASLSSNLSDDVLCQSVTDHFKQWGKMSLVKVLRDPANRPYAFVQYEKDEDANKAINEGQHSILNGRTVRCEKARVNRTLYIQLTDSGIMEQTMKKILARFGEIERIVAVNDNFNVINSPSKITHENWFCKFVYRQDAISAFANLKTKANWNIEWAQNLEDEYSNIPEVTIDRFSIFVGHLDPRIKKEELIERFETHGKIKEAILVNRPSNNFAFIKFKSKEAAASAVERENHSMFQFKTIHVQYREMYNNYRRKNSNENGLKLNLAPPPVTFRKRNFFNENRQNNYNENKNNNKLETFSQALKMKHAYFSRGRFNNHNNIGKRVNKHPIIPPASSTSRKYEFDSNTQQHAHFKPSAYISISREPQFYKTQAIENVDNDIDNKTSNNNNIKIPQSHVKISDMHNEQKKEIQNAAFKNSDLNKVDIPPINNNNILCDENQDYNQGNDLDNDISTMRSNQTYSSAGMKTGYTYSSFSNGENDDINNIRPSHIVPPSTYRYPYYYYYPSKDMQFINTQMHPIIPGDTSIDSLNLPNSANPGYFYTYPGYHGYTPTTPNNQMPAMYPYYLYYNPISMMEVPNENFNSLHRSNVHMPNTHEVSNQVNR